MRTKHQAPGTKHQALRTKHYLLAGLILVALGGTAILLFNGPRAPSEPLETKNLKHNSKIATASPAAAPKPIRTEEKKDPPGYWNGKKITNSNRPPWMSPYHTVNDYGPIHTNKPSKELKPIWEKVFSNETDQDIAALLVIEPGEYVLGDGKGMFDDFDANFLESIKEPIIVKADDDEYVKELKRAVIQTKIDLKARLDKGENLQEIMENTHAEFRELGLYKEELKTQIEELCAKDAFSENDVDDYLTAANKMLEERGCKPFVLPEMYKRSLVLWAKANVEEKKDEQ